MLQNPFRLKEPAKINAAILMVSIPRYAASAHKIEAFILVGSFCNMNVRGLKSAALDVHHREQFQSFAPPLEAWHKSDVAPKNQLAGLSNAGQKPIMRESE